MAQDVMLHRRTSSDEQFGTGGDAVTVVEKQSGVFHVTEIRLSAVELISITGGAAQANGVLLYTLPEGSVDLVKSAMHVYLTGTTAHENDTPEVALGTAKATGAIATLGAAGSGTYENLFGPHVMTGIEDDGTEGALNLSGGAGTTGNSSIGKLFVDGDTKTVYLNIADTWAATAGSVTANGTVWLTWIGY